MLKKYFSNKPKSNQRLSALLVVVIVAGLGAYLLIGSHAASPYASTTADSGTLASGAVKQSCSGSTDGNCVVFGSSSSSSSYYSGKLLGLNSSISDLSELGDSTAQINGSDGGNIWQELGVNSVRGELDLSGTTFEDPNYDGTTAQWIDTTTSEHIVPEPLLNQYIEMSQLNIPNFVSTTVSWCQTYCAGGSFYSTASQTNQSPKANGTYAPQALEILNEPYGTWWGYPVTTADEDAYGTLLKDLQSAFATAGLSNIKILAAANDNSAPQSGAANWNSELVKNGGFAAAGGVTEHPYGPVDTSCSPSTSTTGCTVTSGDTSGTNTNGWGLTYYINKFLTTNGLSTQANNVYATEVGYCNTTTADECSGGEFPELQKDQNIDAIINQLATVSWLKGIEYFNLIPYQDCDSDGCAYNTYGFYTPYPALAVTPAFAVFQAAAQANAL